MSKYLIWKKIFLSSFSSLLLGASGLLLYFYLKQNKYVYAPDSPAGIRFSFLSPHDFGLYHNEEVRLLTEDGETLQSWLIKVDEEGYKKVPTILFFHENAGNLSHRLPCIRDIIRRLNCNVFIVSYRGYGNSSGEPNEEGIRIDALTIYHYLINREDLKDSPIIVFGRSIGGAVAIDLVDNINGHKISGLIVENTFTSINEMIDYKFPPLSVFKFLSKNKWSSIETIRRVNIPTLFIFGEKDNMVPKNMMNRLYDQCPSQTKIFKSFPNGGHMDTYAQRGYYRTLLEFLYSIGAVID